MGKRKGQWKGEQQNMDYYKTILADKSQAPHSTGMKGVLTRHGAEIKLDFVDAQLLITNAAAIMAKAYPIDTGTQSVLGRTSGALSVLDVSLDPETTNTGTLTQQTAVLNGILADLGLVVAGGDTQTSINQVKAKVAGISAVMSHLIAQATAPAV